MNTERRLSISKESPVAREGAHPAYFGTFGLSREPFGPDFDSAYFYETAGARHALRFVQMAIMQLSPVILVQGRRGSGKTTFAHLLTRGVPPELQVGVMGLDVTTADEPAPEGTESEDPFQRLLAAFRQPAGEPGDDARERFMNFVGDAAAKGRVSLLMVDDAHRVPENVLTTLQRLLDVRPEAVSPLLVVLIGRQGLRAQLDKAPLEGLGRRIEAMTLLPALRPAETAGYVRHRIEAAGGSPDLFDDEALAVIHERAAGVPGTINWLCDACLTVAYHEGWPLVDAAVARAVPDAPEEETPAAAEPPAAEPDDTSGQASPEDTQDDAADEPLRPAHAPSEVAAPPPATTPHALASSDTPSPSRNDPPRASEERRPGTGDVRTGARPASDAPERRPARRTQSRPPAGREVVEQLLGLPGSPVVVLLDDDEDGVAAVQDDAVREVLGLATACLSGAPVATPVVAFSGGATCLLDASRGLAVAGAEGFNIGAVRRVLRTMLPHGEAPRPRSFDPAGFREPWQSAIWRLGEVIDRTISPRRLVLDVPAGATTAVLANGLINAPRPGGLFQIADRLREAVAAGERARFRLEPTDATVERGAEASDLLIQGVGLRRGTPTEPLRLSRDGWPQTVPGGVTFGALTRAAAVARRFAGADPRARLTELDGGIMRTVAWQGTTGPEVDADWLRMAVRVGGRRGEASQAAVVGL